MSLMSRLLAMRAGRTSKPQSDAMRVIEAMRRDAPDEPRNIYVSKTGTAHRPGCRYWHDDNLYTEAEVDVNLEVLNWGSCCREEA